MKTVCPLCELSTFLLINVLGEGSENEDESDEVEEENDSNKSDHGSNSSENDSDGTSGSESEDSDNYSFDEVRSILRYRRQRRPLKKLLFSLQTESLKSVMTAANCTVMTLFRHSVYNEN